MLRLLPQLKIRAASAPLTTRLHGLFLTVAVCGIGAMTAIVAIEPAAAGHLTEEDGLVESLTMLCFAGASVLCALLALRTRGSLRYYLLLWFVLSLLFFGEEVSWGQRWLGYETPELLSSNYQGEANLHNLPWLTPRVVDDPTDLVTSQGAFYAGFFAYFLALPAGLWIFRPLGRLGDRVGFPPMPAALLIAIWLPVAASFVLATNLSFGPSRAALNETRELHFALSIFLYALLLASYSGRDTVLDRGANEGA